MKKLIICNKNFDKKKLKNLIEWHLANYGSIRMCKLIKKIKNIGFYYSTKAGISLGPEDLIIPKEKYKTLNYIEKLLKKNKKRIKKGILNTEQFNKKYLDTWIIINESLKEQITKTFKEKDLMNPVYMMISSGARGNLTQIKQLIGIRGLMSDSKGNIINLPIKKGLKEGLNIQEYFVSCYGARKGIIDTALKTANSGYLTRRLIYICQNIFIKQADCKTKAGQILKVLKNNKKEFLETKKILLGKVVNENIHCKNKISITKGQDICNFIANKIIKSLNYILLRTTLTCQTTTGLCQLCYGWNLTNNKIVNIGESVGILAAQSIGEPGTQLTMRTFHTGGVYNNKSKKVIQTPENGIINFSTTNTKKIKNNYGNASYLLISDKTFLLEIKKRQSLKIKAPDLSIIFVKPKQRVFKNQIIAEIPKWKKRSKPIKKENDLEVTRFKNSGTFITYNKKPWLINGFILKIKKIIKSNKNIKPNKKYKKCLYHKVKTNCILNYKNIKKIKILYKNKKVKNDKFLQNYTKNKKYSFYINQKNIKLIKNKFKKIGKFTQTKKKENIKYTGLFIEKRGKKTLIKHSIPFQKQKNLLYKLKNNKIIKKNQPINSINIEKEKNKDIIAGLPKIENILECRKNKYLTNGTLVKKYINLYKKRYKEETAIKKTIFKIQNKLIKKIQNVYKSQNIEIANKHIEIVIKQMTSNYIIIKKGSSNLLPGEIINCKKIEKINKSLKHKIRYEPIILGISKISLSSDSFISSACFQDTTRVLTKAAIMGKIDWLKGLKENIIIGKLTPTGSSWNINAN